ncbi:acyltransferase family protein [Arcanobacterium phocae]|uniref:acyltransferase family protein n=1 Tax=Arcanobacterium phocae TaxID=131112 RepID=UPI001C0EC7A7|nr:acyltransferase [Arcanobacterium phocae]
MNIFLVALLAVTVFRARIMHQPDVESYISHAHTTHINGLFILIVFYAHVRTYIPVDPHADSWMLGLATGLGQLMVALFLFYSGFGVHESIRRKPGYVQSIPVKRFGVTWINFACVVAIYALVGLLLGRDFTLAQVVLAFTGWTSVGNSAWYIFAILVLYALTFVVYSLVGSRPHLALVAMFAVTLAFSLLMWWAKDFSATYSYNTVLCYPLGMAWSAYRAPVEKWLRGAHSWRRWLFLLVTTTAGFVVVKNYAGIHYLVFQMAALWYCAVAVLVTMVIHLDSPVLAWCGRNLFWIYVLQRLPMMVLTYAGWAEYRYVFVVVSLVVTVILAFLISRIVDPFHRKMITKLQD